MISNTVLNNYIVLIQSLKREIERKNINNRTWLIHTHTHLLYTEIWTNQSPIRLLNSHNLFSEKKEGKNFSCVASIYMPHQSHTSLQNRVLYVGLIFGLYCVPFRFLWMIHICQHKNSIINVTFITPTCMPTCETSKRSVPQKCGIFLAPLLQRL